MMKKTIKMMKQLRLDELIKGVQDGEVKEGRYMSSGGDCVRITQRDFTVINDAILDIEELYMTEVEKEITEATRLPFPIVTLSDGNFVSKCGLVNSYYSGHSIEQLKTVAKKQNRELRFVYKQNKDGSIGELIWKSEVGE